MLVRLLAAILALNTAAALRAGELLPDISEELAQARQAWAAGDALNQQLGGPNPERYAQILKEQRAAYQRANQIFRNALKTDPDSPQALAEYGRFWLAQNEFALAKARLEAAWTAGGKPDWREPLPACGPRAAAVFTAAEKADLLRTLGGLSERAGESTRAVACYKAALGCNAGDPRNAVSLAVCLCAAGRPDEAVRTLAPWENDAKIAPPLRALGLYTLAVAREECGYLDAALPLYRQAEELAKQTNESAAIVTSAGMAIARLEDCFDEIDARRKQRVEANAERARQKDPPLPIPDERADFIDAARACERGVSLKNGALADPAFQTALEQARNGEGAALDQNPQAEPFLAALQSFQNAIAKCPKFARAHYELALCNVLAGRFSAARPLLDAAALYNPYNPAILDLQGEVLLELGQWEESAAAFKRILELDPQSGRANFGLARAFLALRTDRKTCQTALDALERATQYGVRDERSQDMREQLTALIARFDRGEAPPAVPVIRGKKAPRALPPDESGAWNGSIFGR